MTQQQAWVLGALERAERRSRGEDPFLEPPPPTKRQTRKEKLEAATITIPMADYKRLLEAAESDDMIANCEKCGAWIDKDDPAYLSADDYQGCVYSATYLKRDRKLCRRYRALEKVR